MHYESLRNFQNGQNGPIKVSRSCIFHVIFFPPAAFDIIALARPLQVTTVAADESSREGEDGPRCSRRRGVLVDYCLFVSSLLSYSGFPLYKLYPNNSFLFISSGWISRISVTTSQMWWCAGWWRGLCCGPPLTGGRYASTGSGLQLLPPLEHLHPPSSTAATR